MYLVWLQGHLQGSEYLCPVIQGFSSPPPPPLSESRSRKHHKNEIFYHHFLNYDSIKITIVHINRFIFIFNWKVYFSLTKFQIFIGTMSELLQTIPWTGCGSRPPPRRRAPSSRTQTSRSHHSPTPDQIGMYTGNGMDRISVRMDIQTFLYLVSDWI